MNNKWVVLEELSDEELIAFEAKTEVEKLLKNKEIKKRQEAGLLFIN